MASDLKCNGDFVGVVSLRFLPGEGGEGHGGVRRPRDDVEQDDDQGDLRHLPLVLQPVVTLHRVAAAAVAVSAAGELPHSPENHTHTHTPVLYLSGHYTDLHLSIRGSLSPSSSTFNITTHTDNTGERTRTDWLVERMARKMQK